MARPAASGAAGRYVLPAFLVLLVATGCWSHAPRREEGKKIVFSAPVEDTYLLVIVNADGSGKPTIPPGQTAAEYPQWSPDGSKIAFYDSDDVSTYVSVVRADGSHYVRLFNDENTHGNFTWSGKSDELAYEYGAILVKRADGGRRRTRVNGEYASWSPDGRRIAFVRGDSLRVIDSDGSGDRVLARGVGSETYAVDAVWSSDSRKLAYTTQTWKNPKRSCESGGDCDYIDPGTNTRLCRLHIVDVDTKSQVRVAGGGLLGTFYRQCDIAWSPDGKQVAFTRRGVLYSVTADGKRERRLGARGFVAPWLWSPDGRRIAFHRSGSMYVLDLRSRKERRLARTDDLSWSPDGKAVALTRTLKEPVQDDEGNYSPGEYVIETIDVDTGRVRRIWPSVGTCDCSDPVWQP